MQELGVLGGQEEGLGQQGIHAAMHRAELTQRPQQQILDTTQDRGQRNEKAGILHGQSMSCPLHLACDLGRADEVVEALVRVGSAVVRRQEARALPADAPLPHTRRKVGYA